MSGSAEKSAISQLFGKLLRHCDLNIRSTHESKWIFLKTKRWPKSKRLFHSP